MSNLDNKLMKPEDLFKLRFIKDADVSPDGKYVAYSVAYYVKVKSKSNNEFEEEERVAIWISSLSGDKTFQLTCSESRDNYPRWAPDSKKIAFVSNRNNETSQIYLISLKGGEAIQITDFEQGIGSVPVWSPDGLKIAFSTKNNNRIDRTKPYRITRNIYRFDNLGYIDDKVCNIYFIDINTRQVIQLTDDDFHNIYPRWSNNGEEILFISVFDPTKSDGMLYIGDIKIINHINKSIRSVMKNHFIYGAEWYSDNKKIVFLGNTIETTYGTRVKLLSIDLENNNSISNLTENFEYDVGRHIQYDMPIAEWFIPKFFITQDGIIHRSQNGGKMEIYNFAIDVDPSQTLIIGGDRSSIPVGITTEKIIYITSTLNSPSEICIAKLDGSYEKQLTDLNTVFLNQMYLPEVEHLKFNSIDNIEVEGWFLKPSEGDGPYPTILYIHGGPHAAFGHLYSFDFQMLTGAGYACLIINHRGSSGYGDDFGTQTHGDWGNLDFLDLMAGIDFTIEKGLVDPTKLGVCGLSGGGNLTCWIIGHTDIFKAAVPENPVTNWFTMYGVSDIGYWFSIMELGGHPHEIPEIYRKCSPITYAHKCKTPTLLITGEEDYRCPSEQSEQFYSTLKANGCISEMLRLPKSSHEGSIIGPINVRNAQNEALLDWMNRYVK